MFLRATAPEPDSHDAAPLPLADDPAQSDMTDGDPMRLEFNRGEAVLERKAKYRIAGKVCGLNHLKHSKFEDLIPFDICMMWGRLAVEDMKGKVTFKHDSLRLDWVWVEPGAPVDFAYVSTHFSNSHLICPAPKVREAISRLRRGDEIEITGYLVFAKIDIDGQTADWKSSLNRTDTGLGACETIYVSSLRTGNQVYGEAVETQ